MAHKTNISIEPHRMTVPTMDRPSIALAWFLDSIRFEQSDSNEQAMYMVCALCETPICEVSDGDTLRVMFNTALAHTC